MSIREYVKKMAMLDSEGNVVSIDKEERKSLAVPAAVTAAGTAMYASGRSMENNVAHAGKWDEAMERGRNILKNSPNGIPTEEQALSIVDDYVRAGREVAQKRLGGVRQGHLSLAMRAITEMPAHRKALAMGKEKAMEYMKANPGFKDAFEGENYTLDHYKFFSDPNIKKNVMDAHMHHKALGAADIQSSFWQYATPQEKTLINRVVHNVDLDYYKKKDELTKLFKQGKTRMDWGDMFRIAHVGNDKIIGEAKRLAGYAAGGVESTPKVYIDNVDAILGKPIRSYKPAARALMVGGTALGGYGIYHALKNNHHNNVISKKAGDEETPYVPVPEAALAVGAVGAGTAVAAKGMKKSPRRIGVTYGAMESIGSGHKEPAKAIIESLKGDKRFRKYEINPLERDIHGLPPVDNRNYTMHINTGFGPYAKPEFQRTMVTHNHGEVRKTKMPEGMLHYQNDFVATHEKNLGVVREEAVHGGKNVRKYKDYIAYGPVSRYAYSEDKKNALHVGDMPPGISPSKMKDIYSKTPDKAKTLKALSESLSAEGNHDMAKKIGDMANNGKKIIVVSGAGRGDYVALRSKEIVDSLKAKGLDKEYDVLALMGNAIKGDEGKIIKNLDIPHVGYVNSSLFNDIQGAADIHWGATGASTITENLIKKNIQAFPSDWGYGYDYAKKVDHFPKIPGIAKRNEALLAEHGVSFAGHEHPKLNNWNSGNIEYAKAQVGTHVANTSDDIIRLIESPELQSKLREQSKVRSDNLYKEFVRSNSNMKDEIYHYLKKTELKSTLKKLGLIGSGGALVAGGGIYGASQYRKHRQMKKKAEDNNIAPAALAAGGAGAVAYAVKHKPKITKKPSVLVVSGGALPRIGSNQEMDSISSQASGYVDALRSKGIKADMVPMRVGGSWGHNRGIHTVSEMAKKYDAIMTVGTVEGDRHALKISKNKPRYKALTDYNEGNLLQSRGNVMHTDEELLSKYKRIVVPGDKKITANTVNVSNINPSQIFKDTKFNNNSKKKNIIVYWGGGSGFAPMHEVDLDNYNYMYAKKHNNKMNLLNRLSGGQKITESNPEPFVTHKGTRMIKSQRVADRLATLSKYDVSKSMHTAIDDLIATADKKYGRGKYEVRLLAAGSHDAGMLSKYKGNAYKDIVKVRGIIPQNELSLEMSRASDIFMLPGSTGGEIMAMKGQKPNIVSIIPKEPTSAGSAHFSVNSEYYKKMMGAESMPSFGNNSREHFEKLLGRKVDPKYSKPILSDYDELAGLIKKDISNRNPLTYSNKSRAIAGAGVAATAMGLLLMNRNRKKHGDKHE